jgi:hypothetical protein
MPVTYPTTKHATGTISAANISDPIRGGGLPLPLTLLPVGDPVKSFLDEGGDYREDSCYVHQGGGEVGDADREGQADSDADAVSPELAKLGDFLGNLSLLDLLHLGLP